MVSSIRVQYGRALALLLGSCFGIDNSVQAWGKIGHEMIGNLAWNGLSPVRQQQVRQILNGTVRPADENTLLGEIADWADSARYSKYYSWSGPLHYIDIRDDEIAGGCKVGGATQDQDECHFQWTRDCVDSFCVAGSVVNYTQRLEMIDVAPNTVIVEALKFLTHFVGDLHQPLHVSRTTDRGGNSMEVHYNVSTSSLDPAAAEYNRRGRRRSLRSHKHHKANLHSVWDDSIIETKLYRDFEGRREQMELSLSLYIAKVHHDDVDTWADWVACPDGGNPLCTTAWAQESWQDALDWAYLNSDGTAVVSGSVLDETYYETRYPVVQRRLAMAAVRLSTTLDLALGSVSPQEAPRVLL